MNDNQISILLSKLSSIACPLLAIYLLAQKNIGDRFTKNESTLWVLAFSLILAILGVIMADISGSKDKLYKVTLGVNFVVAIICISVFCSYL